MINTKLIATVCYWLQLHRIAYFLNRKRKRIVTFHNVLDDDIYESSVANGVSNSLSQFKAIVAEVSKRYKISNDLNDCRTLTITFDDGYRNQVDTAGRWLIENKIPAYLFVSGKLLSSSESESEFPALIVDYLMHWIDKAPDGEYSIEFNSQTIHLELKKDNRPSVWSTKIWPLFLKDSKSKGRNFFEALDRAYPMKEIIGMLSPKYVEQRLMPATIEQLSQLKQQGWQIGWHTYSHYPLSKLTKEQKEKELECESTICSSGVLSFPYGGPSEVDKECLEIAENLGYDDAVSNVIAENELTSHMFRPRMSLMPDKVMLHFELSGLKYFLKNRHLLPA